MRADGHQSDCYSVFFLWNGLKSDFYSELVYIVHQLKKSKFEVLTVKSIQRTTFKTKLFSHPSGHTKNSGMKQLPSVV